MDARKPQQLRIAIARARKAADAEREAALRVELKYITTEEYLRQVLATAPPLSPEQKERLAALFSQTAEDAA